LRFRPKIIFFKIRATEDSHMLAIFSLLLISTANPSTNFDNFIKQGRAAFFTYDLDGAQSAYEQACGAAAAVQQTALCEHVLGTVAEARGNDAEAVQRYLKALEGWQQAGEASRSQRISTLTNLGSVYRRQRRFSEARQMLDEASELVKTLASSDPELYAIVRSRSGALYGDLDQPERARGLLNEALAGLAALQKTNAPELAYAWSALGMVEMTTGRYKAGESDFRQAVEFANSSLGENQPETAVYATNLALALLVQGEYNRAETLLRRARSVIESRLGPESSALVNVLGELTTVEMALGRFGIAENLGDRTLVILNRQLPAGSPEIVLTQVNLGRVYLREHKIAEAEKILPAAINAERRFFTSGRTLGDGIRILASLRAQQHSWNEAESLYSEALGLYERHLGPDHPDIAPVLREYADVLKHEGAPKAKVRSLEARAKAIANPISRA
jgi:tetratricopeptide (TPR) repeat protein